MKFQNNTTMEYRIILIASLCLLMVSQSCKESSVVTNPQLFEDNQVKKDYGDEEPEIGTWSIAAVDFKTRQIGIAGASCTYNVQGIGAVVPGKGAVIVQGMSSDEARQKAIDLLIEGEAIDKILSQIRDPKFNPEEQQYAIISLDSTVVPVAYTGKELDNEMGQRIAKGVSVQGNVLASQDVLDKTLEAFQNSKGDLAERLVAALEAGASAGGDKRCGDQKARSAFVTVFDETNNGNWPYFRLSIYGTNKGGIPAVEYLSKEFQNIYKESKHRKKTILYIVPE